VNDPRPGGRPDYKVYRSRRKRFGSLRPEGGLEQLRERSRKRGDRLRRDPDAPSSISPGRVIRWLVIAVGAWIALSFVLFMISAQIEGGVSAEADAALSGGSNFFTGSTVLVLGSDQRTGASIDQSASGPSRSDSIMLVHAAFGSVRKLSIPRDAAADIPGHGMQKINAAYAIGGPALTIKTVEQYLGNGLEINHLIEVDFEDFPSFIDAMGGVTVNNKSKICSPEFDNFYKGFNLSKGEQELDGRTALGFARVRKNPCAPGETDIDRAERQQEVMSGIRSKLVSPGTFFRLPLVSWRAPQTIKTDMKGPSLMGLAMDIASGGTGDPSVLKPSCLGCGPGGSLVVPESERADKTNELLGND
jgi:LCP family protein required for cell wall assembly